MNLSDPTMTLVEAVTSRHSVRGFLPSPVTDNVLLQILEVAQSAPSNCNTQPWKVYIVSGTTRERLKQNFLRHLTQQVPPNPDFSYVSQFEGPYRKRQIECAVALYNEMGIARNDKSGRAHAIQRNYEFFDAPHILFLGMDRAFGSSIAVDVGIYAQTLMLTMQAFGISSCALGSMRSYPDLIRNELGIDDDTGILLGICFGYEDKQVAANRTQTTREAVGDVVTFYD